MFEVEDMAAAIRKLRGSRTMKEVARQAGISSTSWSTYEHAKRQPRLPMIRKISHGLGCTVADLQELAWKERRHRLESQETDRAADGGDPDARRDEAADAYRREIHEHLHKVADELTDLFVLLKQPPPSAAS
jgi:transcriptional regulator with XRE-family HTH domain